MKWDAPATVKRGLIAAGIALVACFCGWLAWRARMVLLSQVFLVFASGSAGVAVTEFVTWMRRRDSG
jgi:hypothetical protein